MFVGILCAVGALFLKYRLEHARVFSINALSGRAGIEFRFDSLSTEGVRTLHVKGLHASAPLPGGGKASLEADAVQVHLSLPDMLRGRFAVGEASIQGGRLLLEQVQLSGKGRTRKDPGSPGVQLPSFKWPSFSISGSDCLVELRSVALRQPVTVDGLSFKLSNQSEGNLLTGDVQARVSYEGGSADVVLSGRYRQQESIDADLEISGVNAAGIRSIVPLPEGIDGSARCAIHAWGNPDRQMLADVEVEISGMDYPGLPVPVENVDMAVKGSLRWDAPSNTVTVLACDAQSPLAKVALDGTVDLGQDPPVADLKAVIAGLPVDTLLDRQLPEAVRKLGDLEITLPQDPKISLDVKGPLRAPVLAAHVLAPGIEVVFKPADKKLPKGNLTLANAEFTWEKSAGLPAGTANITNGSVVSAAYGVEAGQIMGAIALDATGISVQPLTAVVSGKALSGAVRYEFADGTLTADLTGTLTAIEKTPLHHVTKDLWIGGDIGFDVHALYARGGRLDLKGSADVTRGMVAFEWWLRKPVGVGAAIEELNLTIVPGKTLEVTGEAFIEDTRLLALFQYVRRQDKWRSKHIRLDIPQLEVNSAGKCINIPYTATGGVCKDGFYESNSTGKNLEDKVDTLGGVFDRVSFLPDNGASPLTCRDAKVSVTLSNIHSETRTAELVVHAAEAEVPPFGETWLLPLGSDDPEYTDELGLKYFEEEAAEKSKSASKAGDGTSDDARVWTFKLSGDTITAPPWEGRNFTAELLIDKGKTEFRSCRAEVGNGHVEGSYVHEKASNMATLKATGESVPAKYVIRHLALPEILEGNITGNVSYTLDQDDPRTTMRSEGSFTIKEGHFLADPLRETFKHAFSDTFAALHPAALQFETATSDVRIEGDHIYTDNLVIQLPGMKITGDGVWVMEGDMDYNVNIAVTPDMAEQLPILRDSFNVEGFRMTQRDIELGFHITGPTSGPTGELAGLPPVGVTLVSGAAEMTGEAMKLLDTPRQMLFSIFRIGGGILGATRTQQQQPEPEQEKPQKQQEPQGSRSPRKRR